MNTQHPVLGLDLGKASFVAAWPPETPTPAKRWPALEIHYKNPDWWTDFLSMLAPDAILCAEPTGAHLLQPILNLLSRYAPSARLYQVQGRTTAAYRENYVSASKTDRFDAIALAHIARDIANGQPPNRIFAYDPALELAVQRLRMLVNAHRRTLKTITREKNRLNILAFNLWPAFAGSSTWLRAVRHGLVTPHQIKQFLAADAYPPPYHDNRARRHLAALAETIPDIDADPAIIESILAIEPALTAAELETHALETRIFHTIFEPPFATVSRRWFTRPGAFPLAIASFHIATHGLTLDMTKNDFVAAITHGPRTNQSGAADKTRVTPAGYAPARANLHLWAQSLMTADHAEDSIYRYREAHAQRGARHPFTAAKTKLCRELWGIAHNPEADNRPLMPSAYATANPRRLRAHRAQTED